MKVFYPSQPIYSLSHPGRGTGKIRAVNIRREKSARKSIVPGGIESGLVRQAGLFFFLVEPQIQSLDGGAPKKSLLARFWRVVERGFFQYHERLPQVTKMRAWRNWQTRMVEGHVPDNGVEVRILSPAPLGLIRSLNDWRRLLFAALKTPS